MLRRLMLAALCCSCVSQFVAASPADEAACRNVARAISGARWGASFAEVYDDCMRSKGYRESDQ